MANPLTLILPLKPEITPEAILTALGQQQAQIDEALKNTQVVHFARFVVLGGTTPNLQPTGEGPYRLAVITSYDGDFDAYIQDFVNIVGAIFDEILSMTSDGGDKLVPVSQHVPAFTAYVAKNDASQQPPNSALSLWGAYSATVPQVLSALAAAGIGQDSPAAPAAAAGA